MECSSVHTHGQEAFGVTDIRLIVQWVLHRCQATPGRVAPIAAISPR